MCANTFFNMKKYSFLFSMMVGMTMLLGFSSCSDEVSKDDIVGVWYYVSMTADIVHPTNKALADEEKAGIVFASAFMSGLTIEFKKNGSWVMSFMGETQTGTWTKKGNNISMSAGGVTEGGGSITINNGVLNLIGNNLDVVADEDTGKTYRALGFTKYEIKIVFKK